MSTEIIVALVGFGSAALGVLAAYLGRTKVQIHRHEAMGNPQPPTAPQGLRLLHKCGIAMIVIGVLGGGGWFIYSHYFAESRSLNNWEQYRQKSGLFGHMSQRLSNYGKRWVIPATPDSSEYRYKNHVYMISSKVAADLDAAPPNDAVQFAPPFYTVYLFDWPWEAQRFIRESHRNNPSSVPRVSNGAFVLDCQGSLDANADRAAWEKLQAAFKAFPKSEE